MSKTVTIPFAISVTLSDGARATCALWVYGFGKDITGPEIVARLMELYEEMI